MPTAEQLYARFYDLEYQSKHDDVDFYVRLAQQAKGDILECACGSGRILLPIAKAGLRITGFDYSPYLLSLAKAKAKPLRQRVRLFRDDLTSCSHPSLRQAKFSLIILAFDSIAYLAQNETGFFTARQTRQRQRLALQRIAEHLSKDGILAMDVFCPIAIPSEHYLRQHFSKQVGNKIWDLSSTISTSAESIFQINYSMEISERNGSLRRWHYPVFGYQAAYHEMRRLLANTGFKVDKVLGSFSGDPYRDGKNEQAIFLCRRIDSHR